MEQSMNFKPSNMMKDVKNALSYIAPRSEQVSEANRNKIMTHQINHRILRESQSKPVSQTRLVEQ